MGEARGKSFSSAQNERMRAVARGVLAKHRENRTEVARLLGVSQPTLSNFVNGKTGAGPQMAEAIARVAGVDYMTMLNGGEPASPTLEPDPSAPMLRNLRGWSEQEQRLRLKLPEVAVYEWQLAGSVAAIVLQDHADEALVLKALDLVRRRTPDEEARIQATTDFWLREGEELGARYARAQAQVRAEVAAGKPERLAEEIMLEWARAERKAARALPAPKPLSPAPKKPARKGRK